MMRGSVMLLLTASCLMGGCPVAAQLDFINEVLGGSYLPPIPSPNDQCNNVIKTTTVVSVETSKVLQPVNLATTRTAVAQALVTVVQAVVTTMAQTETRQVKVPVLQTYEQVAQAVRTMIIEVPDIPPPVVRQVTETKVVASTQVNQLIVTSFTQVVQPVQLTQTQVETAFSTHFQTQTQQERVLKTEQFTPQPIQSEVVKIHTEFRTTAKQLPAVTSDVNTVVVQTRDSVRFATPRPVTSTSVVRETRVNTEFEQVVRTQLAFTTLVNVQTQTSTQVENKVQVVTSTVFSNQVETVISTQVIENQVFDTQFVPKIVFSTQILDEVEQRVVTLTSTTVLNNIQTITGQPEIFQQLITSANPQVQIVTETINNPIQETSRVVITGLCQQTSTGYNYPTPGGQRLNY